MNLRDEMAWCREGTGLWHRSVVIRLPVGSADALKREENEMIRDSDCRKCK